MSNHVQPVVETPHGNQAAEVKRRRWDESELKQRINGDAHKLAIAVRLRAENTVTVKRIATRLQMTVGEIAQRLHMDTWKSLNNKLGHGQQNHGPRLER